MIDIGITETLRLMAVTRAERYDNGGVAEGQRIRQLVKRKSRN